MRMIKTLACVPLAMLFAAGCGDDDGGTNPVADAMPDQPDATGGTPDADLTPDATPPRDPPNLTTSEAGEVRFEYVDFIDGAGPGGRNDSTRITGYFMKNTGDAAPTPTLGTCIDMSNDMTWPLAQSATREYIDIGELLIKGGPTGTVLVPDATGAVDSNGRTHSLAGVLQPYKFEFGLNNGANVGANTRYDVELSGSATWPNTNYPGGLVVPEAFDLIEPGLEAIEITPGADMTFTWETNDTSALEGDEEVTSLVAFIINGQGPQILCAEANDGSITVPAAMVDTFAALLQPGQGATLARQTFVHKLDWFEAGDVTDQRLDFIGVWCFATPLTEPAA